MTHLAPWWNDQSLARSLKYRRLCNQTRVTSRRLASRLLRCFSSCKIRSRSCRIRLQNTRRLVTENLAFSELGGKFCGHCSVVNVYCYVIMEYFMQLAVEQLIPGACMCKPLLACPSIAYLCHCVSVCASVYLFVSL